MPSVSVIMPCFNHARFVEEAATAVLNQAHADLELIVIDDCSSDNSWETIRKLAAQDSRMKLIRHERNLGLPKSRNDGMRIAGCDYLAFCDSDDVWEPDKLAIQVSLLEANPTYGMVYCDTRIIDANGRLTGQRFSDLYPLPETPSGSLFSELVATNFVNVQSAVIGRKCLGCVDHFDEDLRVLEDWWFWVQMSRHQRFLYCAQPLARYRVHSQSMTAMRKRCFPVTRVKIFRRMLKKYRDLSWHMKADIFYRMGVDLCQLGKHRMGRRLLWDAARLWVKDARSYQRMSKAIFRYVQSTALAR